jgi:hypothetical protein
MLLQYAGMSVTTAVAAIPLDDYPLLLCLLSKEDQINVIKVIKDLDDTMSPDEIYIRLIDIRTQFDCPSKQMVRYENQYLSVYPYEDWLPSPSQLEVVDQHSDEFRKFADDFSNIPGRIIHVERIKNKGWLTEYEKQKTRISDRIGHDPSERTLFHGCLRAASQEILQKGFHRELIGIHGNTKTKQFH